MTDYAPPPTDADAPHDWDQPRNTSTHRRNGTTITPKPILADAWETEAALLATCMTKAACIDAAVNAGVTRADFTKPLHAHIWDACVDLRADNPDSPTPAEPVTVHGKLGDASPGVPALITLADHANTGNTGRYAATLIEHSQRRAWLTYAADIIEQVRNGIDVTVMPPTERNITTSEGFWENVAATLAGETIGRPAEVGARSDGARIFYRGRFNNVIGESESMKSFFVQWVCAEEIAQGNHVIFLDFEKDLASVLERMTQIGAHPDNLAEFFHYKRREDPWTPAELMTLRAEVDQLQPTLAVIDGVTNAMTLEGLSPDSNPDTSKFYGGVPLILTKTDAAVVAIDHLIKSRDNRGPGAIGAQHKRAGIDGVSIKVQMNVPGGRGRTGKAELIVDKDAPGWVRPQAVRHGATDYFAEVTFHSDGDSMTVRVDPSSKTENTVSAATGGIRLTGYMDRVSRFLDTTSGVAQSQREICKRVSGTDTRILSALISLEEEGYVRLVPGKGGARMFVAVRSYREGLDAKVEQATPAVSDKSDLFPDASDEDASDFDDWDDQPY